MANLKDIRKRIGSVKSTQKITRAMKLVAGARLRKAQENIERLRPYAVKTHEVLSGVSARVGADEDVHPLLSRREPKNVMLVVLTSDRGLAGAFNSSICKAAYNVAGRSSRLRAAKFASASLAARAATTSPAETRTSAMTSWASSRT